MSSYQLQLLTTVKIAQHSLLKTMRKVSIRSKCNTTNRPNGESVRGGHALEKASLLMMVSE